MKPSGKDAPKPDAKPAERERPVVPRERPKAPEEAKKEIEQKEKLVLRPRPVTVEERRAQVIDPDVVTDLLFLYSGKAVPAKTGRAKGGRVDLKS